MGEARRFGLTPQLDITQIMLEAQQRWLRPAEICEILRNYQTLHITPEPYNRPPNGSLFLFDRKVLRYFRKDGHNWRKNKDGKTVKEAHERLKVGSIDVLHCYYAHGEENSNFQRRSYWMLEEDFMHIVLVHYREVKNKETYSQSKDNEATIQSAYVESPSSSNSFETYNQIVSQATNVESPNSVQTPEYEDAGQDFQASSRHNPYAELLGFNKKPMMDANLLNPYFQSQLQHRQATHQGQRIVASDCDLFSVDQEEITKIFNNASHGVTNSNSRMQIDLISWEEVLGHCREEFQDTSFPPFSSSLDFVLEGIPGGVDMLDKVSDVGAQDETEWQLSEQEIGSLVASDLDVSKHQAKEGKAKYYSLQKQLSLDLPNVEGDKGLQKHDSFSRWMIKELGEVGDSNMKSSSAICWDAVENEIVVNNCTLSQQDHMDSYLLSPSISQDQLFSINDFSPNRTYSGSGTKILITGRFLLNKNDISKFHWSCMFGEVEVPAEVLADGILQCHAPPHKSGRVPFYVTCSNRLACSEVREFEYLEKDAQKFETLECYSGSSLDITLYIRLEKFLSEVPLGNLEALPGIPNEKAHIASKISSLLLGADDVLPLVSYTSAKEGFSPDNALKHQLLQTVLKEKLCAWLLHKVAEDGKGPNVLDKEGQGVIHLAAALGYHWAIPPIIVAGVNINFRDTHGWTALHWAAACGRETAVIALLALGAASGALTDPITEFPSGRTPADLAATKGHKGIAGFLAESSLTSYLSSLTLKQSGENDLPGIYESKAIDNSEEKKIIRGSDGDPLKDSLDAVRSAVQAAARIHQVFRVQSFQRKEQVKFTEDKLGMSNEHALSLVSVKTNKVSHRDDPVHAAAARIQNKFRGWKGRKEFLIIRQRIVKIQAHVRGHQVRKHFRKIVWSVGIVEKVILRWRRKGSGLRGFRSEGLVEGPAVQALPSKEEDYDFLQEGRKQTEARLERALARVKSMVQYPEARDQYRRLLTGVEEFQESKVVLERILNDSEETTDADMMLDLDELLEDDIFMPTN